MEMMQPESIRPPSGSHIVDAFLSCDSAARRGLLIHRPSKQDKEFHFQNWFSARLDELRIAYDPPARNLYPDFRVVALPEGYEVKGLAYPGREATYDSNSQSPSGFHNGRNIFYLFGRYPIDPDGNDYPVIDLVFCHGDFLNADHAYVHKNKSVRGFGSYGDIMIRDRKMYVAPTPFALTEGTTGQRTLILPEGQSSDPRLEVVGKLTRVECPRLVVGYSFDLRSNTLKREDVENPAAGAEHRFVAYRLRGSGGPTVGMRVVTPETVEPDDA
jgi:hypothetical protein